MTGARPAKLWLVAAAAAVSLALAGCGHSASVGADRTLRVSLSEYQVVPQKVQASSGVITIIVHNVGKLTHNLAVLDGTQQVGVTPPIWPGTVAELSMSLPPGTYTLTSTLFSDQALGEHGTLTIT